MAVKTMYWNGTKLDLPDGNRESASPFGSHLELLKFYVRMLGEGKIKIGSSGFKRMCEIKNRVAQEEKQMLTFNPALEENTKRRTFIKDLIEMVNKAEESLK
tara:strand:+ start:266 stop:571 length:306 start_codon:yes stop_codon:yes gene_type:complete